MEVAVLFHYPPTNYIPGHISLRIIQSFKCGINRKEIGILCLSVYRIKYIIDCVNHQKIFFFRWPNQIIYDIERYEKTRYINLSGL